jgi:hypothetical protein
VTPGTRSSSSVLMIIIHFSCASVHLLLCQFADLRLAGTYYQFVAFSHSGQTRGLLISLKLVVSSVLSERRPVITLIIESLISIMFKINHILARRETWRSLSHQKSHLTQYCQVTLLISPSLRNPLQSLPPAIL